MCFSYAAARLRLAGLRAVRSLLSGPLRIGGAYIGSAPLSPLELLLPSLLPAASWLSWGMVCCAGERRSRAGCVAPTAAAMLLRPTARALAFAAWRLTLTLPHSRAFSSTFL